MEKSQGKPVPVKYGSSQEPSSRWVAASHATPPSTALDSCSPAASRAISAHAVAAERQPVGEGTGVVDVEGAPAAVPGLHAEVPAHPAPDGLLHPLRVVVSDPAQREDHLGGVVDVGIVVVVELERPAAGRQLGSLDGP